MRRIFVSAVAILTLLLHVSALGQDMKREPDEDETCSEPIFERKEVSRPAKFKTPDVGMTDEARAKARVVVVGVAIVLCRTGRVTDVRVVKSAPDGMTERVVEAVRRMKFTPAEKEGEEVSQRVRIEFEFHVF